MSRKTVNNIIFLVVLAGIAAFYYVRYRVAPDIASRRVVFETPTGIDSLDNHLDHNLLVVFYASWCGPCMKELPALAAINDQLTASSIRILALTDDPVEKIDLVRNRFKPPFPLYKLEGKLQDVGVYTIPTVFLMNNSGEVVFEHVDYYDWSQPENVDRVLNLVSN